MKEDGTNPVPIREEIELLIFNAEKINEHGKRAERIVSGMMQFGYSEQSEKRPDQVNRTVQTLCNVVYHSYVQSHMGYKCELLIETDPAVTTVKYIPEEIARALNNIMINAFDAVKDQENKKVIVSTKLAGNKVQIKVEDNGVGIPVSIRSKIFEPFFTTKPTLEGTGLGLSIAHEIVVKGHDGNLFYQPAAVQGSIFVMELPVG